MNNSILRHRFCNVGRAIGRIAVIFALVCQVLMLATPAQAWERGRGGWHNGIWWGPGVWVGPPYYGYPPAYAPYPPGYVYSAPPTTIIQQAPAAAAAPAVWYYCDTPQGYYPYVPSCNVAWRQVPATPPAGGPPGSR